MDRSQVPWFIGMARLGHGLLDSLGSPRGRTRGAPGGNQSSQHLLAMRHMVVGSDAVVCWPDRPQAIRGADGADVRAGPAPTARQRERFRPAVTVQMGDPIFPIARVWILAVGAQTDLRCHPYRTAAI